MRSWQGPASAVTGQVPALPFVVTSPQTWQERIDVLAHGEVQPLVFATDVERRERVTVHVVLVDPADDVGPSGHASHGPVFSVAFDEPDQPDDEQVRRMRQEAVAQFTARLRTLLSGPPA